MEPVYRTLEIAAAIAYRVTRTVITDQGMENLPAHGGAVIAINHTGYIDFLPAALVSARHKRRIRFMIKAEMNDVRIVNFLITRSGTIPVNRKAGAEAYTTAVRQLRAGEVVGVYPEATISRSFELKEFKTGAARMALEAQVPLLPLIVWGAHRRWTKGHPKNLFRKKIPITVRLGTPLAPTGTVDELDTALHSAMNALLREVQEEYPHPTGEWWVPRRLGGSAPTPAEATLLDQAARADRARRATGHP